MIVNTKKASTKFHPTKFHYAYGIQNWLCSKKYCVAKDNIHKVDKEQYKELIKAFCLSMNPEFDFTKGMEKWEEFIQNNFPKFCLFANKKFDPR